MKKVTILLSSFNGEAYLEEQLESIVAQKDVLTNILVRDDGSSDHTCDILEQWHHKANLSWYCGENIGPARSFMDLRLGMVKLTGTSTSIRFMRFIIGSHVDFDNGLL